ncbi:MAG: DUF5652 family protein [Candidatus Nomurabacteria bacterium]|nr:DUF5652 family protein [Candidatus Nomurabacteria bacterium]
MNTDINTNILFMIVLVWSIFWKCYSTWTAAKNNNKKWFIALVVLNTVGILDMIYIFHVSKKNWSDVKSAFKSGLKIK